MSDNIKRILVKFNEASTDDVAQGNLVKRGLGISTESLGFFVRTEDDDFFFVPSSDWLMNDGAAGIGISHAGIPATVKDAIVDIYSDLNALGDLAELDLVRNAQVASDAAIGWSKISKAGASALDISAAPIVGGKIPAQYLPSVATSEVFTVSNEAQMLLLDAQPGDYAIRTDLGKKFMLVGTSTVAADWVPVGDGGVLSVDGRTGVVILSDKYKDIAWVPSWSDVTSKPTTVAGFGITDVYTKGQADGRYAVLAHNHDGTYEPVIVAGTSSQYWKGDKTWGDFTVDVQAIGDMRYSALDHTHDGRYYTKTESDGRFSLSDHTHTSFGALTLSGLLSGVDAEFSSSVSAQAFFENGASLASKYSVANHTHTTFGAFTLGGSITPDADSSYSIGSASKKLSTIYATTGVFQTIQTEGGYTSVINSMAPTTDNVSHIGGVDKRYASASITAIETSVLIAGSRIDSPLIRLNGVDVTSLFATSGHNHNSTYSLLGHTHDDRYYTESEINTLLSGKSDNLVYEWASGGITGNGWAKILSFTLPVSSGTTCSWLFNIIKLGSLGGYRSRIGELHIQWRNGAINANFIMFDGADAAYFGYTGSLATGSLLEVFAYCASYPSLILEVEDSFGGVIAGGVFTATNPSMTEITTTTSEAQHDRSDITAATDFRTLDIGCYRVSGGTWHANNPGTGVYNWGIVWVDWRGSNERIVIYKADVVPGSSSGGLWVDSAFGGTWRGWHQIASKQYLDTVYQKSLFIGGTAVTITNSTTETALSTTAEFGSNTLPADLLKRGTRLKIRIYVECTAYTSTSTVACRLKFAGTTVATATSPSIIASGAVFCLEFSAYLTTAPGTGAGILITSQSMDGGNWGGAVSRTINTTASIAVTATLQCSSATVTVKGYMASIEAIG